MEGEEVTMRQMLRELSKENAAFQTEVRTSFAEIKVHGKYAKETLDEHGKKITDLNDTNNKQKGALWAATTFGFVALIKIIKDIFS